MSEEPCFALEPMARVIAERLAERPEHFITHPAELRRFRGVSDEALRQFAHEHGWRVVRRVGGRQIEFYNDAEMQARSGHARESATTSGSSIR